MKKINQYKLLAGICALSLFTACDFEELNTNPFEMTDEMGIRDGVAVGGAVTAMQRAVVTVGTQADDTDAINQYHHTDSTNLCLVLNVSHSHNHSNEKPCHH